MSPAWFQKAVTSGFAGAAAWLPRDDAPAPTWFCKAADGGSDRWADDYRTYQNDPAGIPSYRDNGC